MNFIISQEVAARFPELRIGVLVAHGIDNAGTNEDLERLKSECAKKLRERLNAEALEVLPSAAVWREVYQSLGVSSKKHLPTNEALLKRVLKGGPLPTISKAVDSYLCAETETYLPIGGYDLDRISGDIRLRTSPGDEPFQPLGSAEASDTTLPGELVYADSSRILTRRWNYKDCEPCKITQQSRSIILMSEAPDNRIGDQEVEKTLELISEHIKRFCGGETRTFVTNAAGGLEYSI
ncbi:hypothetical protein HYS54_05275 [Candidatus Micrarchaeota archaeon]|nr:hypothetical protein [Candidatus Micrarchaeota archaeon]